MTNKRSLFQFSQSLHHPSPPKCIILDVKVQIQPWALSGPCQDGNSGFRGRQHGSRHIFPNQYEELGPPRALRKALGIRAGRGLRTSGGKGGAGPADHSQQPLDQDPERRVELAPLGDEKS